MDATSEPRHVPVMLEEAMHFLAPSPGDVIVDATAGMGGHARAIAQKILPGGVLIAVDRDVEMLELARKNLAEFGRQVRYFHANFTELGTVLSQIGYERVDGVLYDLGVSSAQLDDPTRGLSFQRDSRLDMRLDRSQRLTAEEVVNTYSESKLADIFWQYGEERWARKIARRIVQERAKGPITGTIHLAELIHSTIGGRRGHIHPATRCFQALRIFVNSEILSLQEGLHIVYRYLKETARVVVISFESLTDRIVKESFREQEDKGLVRVLTPKVVRPTDGEVERNARSRSAKMRAAERTGADGDAKRG